jgi:YgiT-type zinc finger domain-containing protein
MKCVVCKNGETRKGYAIVTLTKDESIIVFKKVPAEICSNCGEKYFSEEITANLLKTAEEINKSGIQIDVREYKAA